MEIKVFLHKESNTTQRVQTSKDNPDDYVIFNTNAFDDLPLQAQECLKNSMGEFMKSFANNLLEATLLCVASQGKDERSFNILEIGLDLMSSSLDELVR